MRLPIPPETLKRAAAMRDNGMSWGKIARAIGIGEERFRRLLDPGFSERRAAMIRKARETRGFRGEPRVRVSPEEAKAALSSIPSDTRSFTAKAMGDPLPGRSALDKSCAKTGPSALSRTVFHTIEVAPVEEWKKSVLGIAAQEPIRADRMQGGGPKGISK
jgi:hypothetical protein